jgi:hypothetical protein
MAPSLIKSSDDPFAHFVVTDFYEPELAQALSRWLASEATWQRSVHHFYDQFELSFNHVQVPEAIASALLTPTALHKVKELAEELFATELRPQMGLTAHKLIDRQGIGIHTDKAPGAESHRIIVQLSKDWQDGFGGHLVLFGSGDVNDVRSIFRHVFNTAIGFPLGHRSYHAVTDVSSGERLTVIYGLWSTASEFDASANADRVFAAG